MTLRKGLSALVATSLVFGGAASAAAAGAADSLRQPARVAESENLAGGGAIGWIIAALVAAGVALVIVEDDSDEPVSP